MLLPSEPTVRLKIFYTEKWLLRPYESTNFSTPEFHFSVSLLLVKNAVVVRSNGEATNILYQKTIIESS